MPGKKIPHADVLSKYSIPAESALDMDVNIHSSVNVTQSRMENIIVAETDEDCEICEL